MITSRGGGGAIWVALAGLLIGSLIAAVGIGRIAFSPMEVLAAIAGGVGLDGGDPRALTVVTVIRMPRTLAAALSGATLAAAGAALQGCLRNPLAGPQTVGVLAGAGFGGALGLVVLADAIAAAAAGFVSGIAAIGLVLWIGRLDGKTSIIGIVLAGVVISGLFAGLTTLLQFLVDPEKHLPAIVFWLMGSFSRATARDVAMLAVPCGVTLLVLFGLALRINALTAGDEEAAALGLPVERDRWVVLGVVALGCAAVVAVAGLVGWVGLVVPHVARMIVGPDHRVLLPASALLGASYLVWVDIFCRTITAAEIPIGAVTALIGAPIVIVLLKRTYARSWNVD
ncbi:iron ABC transporter permease [Xanthobacteraceae bacterium Astr-EGSB]|uniref:FecCD family ABC transporter permease n=1 Tax=Astrobacterium formosum TaxID=3069710 RepID=UPI0027B5A3E9|nr:iron ABC transporter permease [Xanthobacteraceae bacterium Astr-EGSB]